MQHAFFPPVTTSSKKGGDSRERLLICFSHLRWDFVFQRPQHLMSRFAAEGNVLFWEEPQMLVEATEARLDSRRCARTGVTVATPILPAGLDQIEERRTLKRLLDAALAGHDGPVLRWYYTPMMLSFSEHIPAECVIYDCMDELANFKNAPPELIPLETRLLEEADVVFTGGYSLYEAKRERHPNIHPLPSSVDVAHFRAARAPGIDPEDQAALPHPRLGFYGVVDERMDLDLLARVADARPHWSIMIIGPVVKISEADLPRRPNLHYLGRKDYAVLPDYLRGWDVALMPFAINEATRFISPTKTPEYLAAGCPVVSTAICDVVRHYGDVEAVKIADTPDAFISGCEQALALAREPGSWRAAVEARLSHISWDRTYQRMRALIEEVVTRPRHPVNSTVALDDGGTATAAAA